LSRLDLSADVRRALAEFAQLDVTTVDEFRVALQAAPFTIRRRDFAVSIASAVPSTSTDIEDITSTLVFLLSYRRSNLEQFVDDVVADMQDVQAGDSRIEPENALALKERLLTFLQIDALQLRSKASELIFEDAKVFQSSRIITDIRPVFSGTRELEISGGLIVHILKLQFMTATGGNETYVSMDDDDLRELKQVIERAQQKSQLLRTHLKMSRLIDLNPGANDNA
jgi:hypothetical protein